MRLIFLATLEPEYEFGTNTSRLPRLRCIITFCPQPHWPHAVQSPRSLGPRQKKWENLGTQDYKELCRAREGFALSCDIVGLVPMYPSTTTRQHVTIEKLQELSEKIGLVNQAESS